MPEPETMPHQNQLKTEKSIARNIETKIADLRTEAPARPSDISPGQLQGIVQRKRTGVKNKLKR